MMCVLSCPKIQPVSIGRKIILLFEFHNRGMKKKICVAYEFIPRDTKKERVDASGEIILKCEKPFLSMWL